MVNHKGKTNSSYHNHPFNSIGKWREIAVDLANFETKNVPFFALWNIFFLQQILWELNNKKLFSRYKSCRNYTSKRVCLQQVITGKIWSDGFSLSYFQQIQWILLIKLTREEMLNACPGETTMKMRLIKAQIWESEANLWLILVSQWTGRQTKGKLKSATLITRSCCVHFCTFIRY